MTPRIADQPQEHLGGDRVLLRPRRAVAGRRPDQPAGAADARAAAVGPRAGRPEPQAGRLRGARRAHLALRPHLPDRDARRHEHRPDLAACRIYAGVDEYGFLDHAVPQGRSTASCTDEVVLAAGRRGERRPTSPRPTRRPTDEQDHRGPRHRPLPDGDFQHDPRRPGPVHRHLAQADGRRLGRPDPVPGARRRQPGADGLEHAAAGGAAAGHRAADRRHRAWRRTSPRTPAWSSRPQQDGTVTYVDSTRVDHRRQRHLQLRKFVGLNERTCLNQKPIVKLGPEGQEGRDPRRRRRHLQGRAGPGPQRPGRVHVLGRLQLRGRDHHQRAAGEGRHLHLDPHRGVRDRDPRDEARQGGVHPRHPQRLAEGAAATSTRTASSAIGTYVKPGDILVGKVSPKSKSELTPEEKLLHAIFGRAGEDVKND